MKKFLLLPLVAMVLTACTSSGSSNSAEVSEAASPAWQAADIQPTAMPSSMNQPVVTQPSYNNTQSVPQALPQPVSQPTYSANETVGNCQVVRQANGTPDYTQIQKGCYTDSNYTVGKQDTIYLISYLSGTPLNQLAKLNNLTAPYKLKVGQTLRVR